MLITCPNCGTNFSIPDAALGTDGRKLKCAKCGHKWFQTPMRLIEEDEDLDFMPRSAPPPPEPPFRREFDDPPPVGPSFRRAFDDPPPVPRFGGRTSLSDLTPAGAASEFDPAATAMLDAPLQPVPDVFSHHPTDKRKGGSTAPLWGLLALLVVGGLGGAGYYYQDMVVEFVPEAGDLLAQAGLRHEKPGAGLELRKAGTPERFVLNEIDVLVVRGIIANISDRIRPVPTMKLVLLDKTGQPVQEKLSRPPATALDPQGTASFKIMLERPDPSAVEVVVVFVDKTEATDTPPARPLGRVGADAPPSPALTPPAVETPPPSPPAALSPAPAAASAPRPDKP